MDHHYCRWPDADGRPMSPGEVCTRLRERLAGHLVEAGPRVVAVTHTLPFSAQLVRRPSPTWQFAQAFMGSAALGEMLLADRRIELVISGHTHRPSDQRVGHLRAVVSPLGYRREWPAGGEQHAVREALREGREGRFDEAAGAPAADRAAR
jgi:hypothetical protein